MHIFMMEKLFNKPTSQQTNKPTPTSHMQNLSCFSLQYPLRKYCPSLQPPFSSPPHRPVSAKVGGIIWYGRYLRISCAVRRCNLASYARRLRVRLCLRRRVGCSVPFTSYYRSPPVLSGRPLSRENHVLDG
jgi:hypothetical protein